MRFVVILFFFLMSCGTEKSLTDLLPQVYKMDIQQGNEIDSEMLLKLKPGMTKSQVRFVLGTPLIQDSFHNNRWDYLYAMRKEGRLIEKRHVILNFEKDLLKNITGEVIPKGENESLNNAQKTENPIDSHDKDKVEKEESSWLDSMKFWEKNSKPSEEILIKSSREANTNIDREAGHNNQQKNSDVIQRIDTTESINEAVKDDIRKQNSDTVNSLGGELKATEKPALNKEVIIKPETNEESDYFKLLLEKIGF